MVSKIFPFTQIEPFGSYILFPGVSDYETGKNICSKFNSNVLDFTNENYQAKFESVYTGLELESSSIDYFYIGKTISDVQILDPYYPPLHSSL